MEACMGVGTESSSVSTAHFWHVSETAYLSITWCHTRSGDTSSATLVWIQAVSAKIPAECWACIYWLIDLAPKTSSAFKRDWLHWWTWLGSLQLELIPVGFVVGVGFKQHQMKPCCQRNNRCTCAVPVVPWQMQLYLSWTWLVRSCQVSERGVWPSENSCMVCIEWQLTSFNGNLLNLFLPTYPASQLVVGSSPSMTG